MISLSSFLKHTLEDNVGNSLVTNHFIIAKISQSQTISKNFKKKFLKTKLCHAAQHSWALDSRKFPKYL